MGVISIRLPLDVEEVYKAHHLKPSKVAKEYLIQEAKRLELQDRMDRLRGLARRPSRPITDLLREVRDEG